MKGQTRNGDCMALKLSGDIYTLISVFEGAPYDDMKELFSVSKSASEIFSQSIIANGNNSESNDATCKCDKNLEMFRGLLADVQSELRSIREENEQLKSNFQEQIDSIKTDFDTLSTDISDSVEEIQNTAANCRQLMVDLNDEQKNCSSVIKNDVKQIRTELKSLYEHIEIKQFELDRKIPNTKNIERRLLKLEANLRVKGPCEASKSASGDDLIDLTGPGEVSLNSENTHPNRNGNNQNSMNASFVAEKLQASSGASNVMISRDPQTGIWARTEPRDSNVSSMGRTTADAPISCPGRNVNQLDPSPNDQNNINMNIKPQQSSNETQNGQTSVGTDSTLIKTTTNESLQIQREPSSESEIANNIQTLNMMAYQCSVGNRFSALQNEQNQPIVPGTSSFSDILQNPSTYDQLNIPVHVSNMNVRSKKARAKPQTAYTKPNFNMNFGTSTGPVDPSVTETMEADDDFIQYVRRRPERYYIGGFKSTINEQKLTNYLLRRGVHVSRINIRRYENPDRAAIQLFVDPDYGPYVQQRGFWPPGVYCRQWYNKNEYRQKTFGDNNMFS